MRSYFPFLLSICRSKYTTCAQWTVSRLVWVWECWCWHTLFPFNVCHFYLFVWFCFISRLPSAESNDIKTCRTRPSFYFSSFFHFYCHWGIEEREGEWERMRWRKAYVIYHVLIVNLFICTLSLSPRLRSVAICIFFVFPHEFRQQDNNSFKYFGTHCAPFGGKSHWKWNWKVSCRMLPYSLTR